jgi:signal transduction histidine kinase
LAEYLDHVRRLCSFLFIIAVALVSMAIHLPESGVRDRTPVYVLLSLAFITGVGVYRFPWRRFHPNWFLIIGVLATSMTSILIAYSGGRASIFYPIFFFIIVASGTYYSAVPLAIITVIVSVGSVSYLVYQDPGGVDRLRSAFEIPTYFVTAFLCHLIYRHLEQSVARAAHAEAESAVAEMREQFVDEASHELRTPLTSLLVAGEFLARGNLTPIQHDRYVGYVQASARRLKQLVDDLLTLARIERGRMQLERELVSLPDLISDAVQAVSPPGDEDRFNVRIGSEIPTVEVDRGRMREIFSNLLGNALKYSPEGSPIDVVCQNGAGRIVISVTDRGIGIPRQSLPHVFDRFYRAPNIRDLTASGSGLGLTITRELVEAHGGEIRAESQGEGQGSTFTVTLPAGPVGPIGRA